MRLIFGLGVCFLACHGILGNKRTQAANIKKARKLALVG
jgi:hypothetical protein